MQFIKKNSLDAKSILPIGVLITNIGNGMYTLAIGKLLYDKTGLTTSFAFVLMIESILTFSTQAIASLAVDRGRAQKSAFIAEFGRGVTVIICGILVLMGYPLSIFFATVIINLLRPFYRTATFAIGPMIAEGQNLAKYNAKTSTFFQIGQFIGAGIAGVIISIFSPQIAIILNGISYIISAICILLANIPEQGGVNNGSSGIGCIIKQISPVLFVKEWSDLVQSILKEKIILSVVLLCTTDFLIVSFINLTYAPLLRDINLQPWWLSVWDSLFALGAIMGAIIFGKSKVLQKSVKFIPKVVIIEGICIFILSTRINILIGISMLALGFANAISVSYFNFTLQNVASSKFHGRISGIRQLAISLSVTIMMPILSFFMNIDLLLSSAIMVMICIFTAISIVIFLKPLVYGERSQ